MKYRIVKTAMFASLMATAAYASDSEEHFSFRNLNTDSQFNITKELDIDALDNLAHTEKAGTVMVFQEMQKRFPGLVSTLQQSFHHAYKVHGRFINQFFFIESLPSCQGEGTQQELDLARAAGKVLAAGNNIELLKTAVQEIIALAPRVREIYLVDGAEQPLALAAQAFLDGHQEWKNELMLGVAAQEFLGSLMKKDARQSTAQNAIHLTLVGDDLLASAKPMLKVALLMPSKESLAMGMQGAHILLSKTTKEPFMQTLSKFYYDKDLSSLGMGITITYLKPPVISNIRYICREVANYHPDTELSDLCCAMSAYTLHLNPPTFGDVRVGVTDLMRIKDYMYYPKTVHRSVLFALQKGKIEVGGPYKFGGISVDICDKTPRTYAQKCEDFDLFRQLARHARNNLGFTHYETLEPSDLIDPSSRIQDLSNTLDNEKQAELFKERHLDRVFQ